MFVAIGTDSRGDSEGQTFGPFTTAYRAAKFAHKIDVATGVIPEDIEFEAQHVDPPTRWSGFDEADLMNAIMDMGWRIEEITHVDEEDEELLDFIAPDNPHVYVKDDGQVFGPFGSRDEALVAALKDITAPVEDEAGWRAAILKASNGQEMLDTADNLHMRASILLADWETALVLPKDLVENTIQLIHDCDWIVTSPAVYSVETFWQPE